MISLVGATGDVTIAIGGGTSLGEVELFVGGGSERFLAQCPYPLDVGESVLVIGVEPGRVVDVERWTVPGI
ncbi:hypothetical protein GOEFS_033_00270 [Gordonia effusa NBRC 100432]|uniref:Uncharacterized protein n=1 Tax=Gordonia effusa NBRC 100432 TaxID=1077974 RepID=H0QXB5_9ACTN|nr:hypothetical protein [Gordonia effusa]GAB17466.1 hypothetical protein GOEFS_033_00270 [Gordonia effusa NBRC 100432]